MSIRPVVIGLSFAACVASAVFAQATAAPRPAPAAQAPATSAGAEVFSVDDVHSTALFRVHHLGAGQFWGRFNDISGTFTVNGGKPEGVTFDVTIKTESVDTGTEKLDQHLRSPDFFNAKEFPNLTFKSTSVKAGPKPGWLEVAGDLSMHGVTKPVTAMMEWTGTNDGPMGRRAGYEATFSIRRSDWGISYGVDKGAIGDEVRIVVGLEGTAGASGAG
jgi:polyisoprenoid-binding protein YceI